MDALNCRGFVALDALAVDVRLRAVLPRAELGLRSAPEVAATFADWFGRHRWLPDARRVGRRDVPGVPRRAPAPLMVARSSEPGLVLKLDHPLPISIFGAAGGRAARLLSHWGPHERGHHR